MYCKQQIYLSNFQSKFNTTLLMHNNGIIHEKLAKMFIKRNEHLQ